MAARKVKATLLFNRLKVNLRLSVITNPIISKNLCKVASYRHDSRSLEVGVPLEASPRRSKSEFPIKLYAMLELADTIPEFAQAVM